MSRALPTSKMSRTAGRRATIGAKPAGKAHRRRLACERLEDRRLLNGVTLITHGFEFLSSNVESLTWLNTMAASIAGQVSEAYTGSAQSSSEVAQITIKVGLAGSSLIVGWSFVNGTFNGLTNPSALNLASSLGAEAVITIDWSSVASTLGISTGNVADAVDAFLTGTASGDLGQQVLASSIHLIGHSRGGSLMSALADDLGKAGISVDQLTTLDPASPPEFGDAPANVWSNVAFADNYWEDSPSLVLPFLDGAIDGADNNWILGRIRG